MVRQRPLRLEIATPPSEEELERAIGKLKCGKAGGESGILPEMVKAVCSEEGFMRMLKELYGGRVKSQQIGGMQCWCHCRRKGI